MAFVHGKAGHISVGAGSDISTYCDQVSLPRSVGTAETSTFGVSAKTFITGLTDATISVSGNWDSALDAIIAPLLGAAASAWIVGPAGSASGKVKYNGDAICTSYQVSAPVGDKVTFSADFQVTGAITRSTF